MLLAVNGSAALWETHTNVVDCCCPVRTRFKRFKRGGREGRDETRRSIVLGQSIVALPPPSNDQSIN